MSNGSKRRRWFQFSLRTLLVLMTALCLLLGWLGLQFDRAQRQRAAIAAIEKADGRFYYDYQCDSAVNPAGTNPTAGARQSIFNQIGNPGRNPISRSPPGPAWLRNLVGVDYFASIGGVYCGTGATDDILGQLRGQKHLRFFHTVGKNQLTDAGLECLSKLMSLESLELASCDKITDAGLQRLSGLAKLQVLCLDDSPVTDLGVKPIKKMTSLKELYLNQTQVTDAGLEDLAELTKLEELYLSNTQVTDSGLKYLEPLTHLQGLSLYKTQVTDAGLKHLKALANLQTLALGGTQVSDAGLKDLKELKSLKTLSLSSTRVHDAGIADLQRALPQCRIWWDGP